MSRNTIGPESPADLNSSLGARNPRIKNKKSKNRKTTGSQMNVGVWTLYSNTNQITPAQSKSVSKTEDGGPHFLLVKTKL